MSRPPLRRTARLGMQGIDIEAHTAAMHRYLHTGQLKAFREQRKTVRQTFGIAKRTLAKKSAAKAGLPQYGVVGPALYAALWDDEAYDVTARQQLDEYAKSLDKKNPRELVVDAARFYLANARHIAYSQTRPIVTISRNIRPPDIPHALDCSGLAITCYWVAGVLDALGPEHRSGFGNTWSLADEGRSVTVADLLPGDLVFYGSCSHVAIYEGSGKVITNGHYPMSREKLSYRSDYWGARTFLPR